MDLPCTAAVLQLHNLSETGLIDNACHVLHFTLTETSLPVCNIGSGDRTILGQCLAALDEVRFRIIFEYFMRVESGKGDTVDL